MRAAGLAARLSGRAEERAELLDVVRVGLDGAPRAVLVHGEAGIGKTSLVRSVCDEVMLEGAQVLWGQCLRFGAVEAMYHPLVLALEGWLGAAGESERAAVVEAVPGAALILPSLGAVPAERPSMLMTVVDALLSRVIAQAPTVLVVDDVQWADPATWDALSYLVAGFARQQLALLTTHRDEAVGSEQFQHWLGNIRRLPGTEELVLARLDQDATTDQIAVLLGRPPEPRLAETVFEKSGGNPYFSELLVRRGDLHAAELPDDLPDELSQALLQAWRAMSDPAREIARILAIAGRPTELQTLGGVAAELGVTDTGSVREAVEAGVVVLGKDGAWGRHPLLAAVLAESYLPGEAAPVHAAWATTLESAATAEGVEELRRLGDLAAHHEQAGGGVAAYEALMRAADLAEELGAWREVADLLTRAADMGDVAADARDMVGRARLLERAGDACFWVGRARDGYRMDCAARDVVSQGDDMLWASKLTAWVAKEAFNLGETRDSPLAAIENLVELAAAQPDSRDHADALRSLADTLFWAERHAEARSVIEDAVAAAHRSGSAAAISAAHGTRFEIVLDTDLAQADRDAMMCWEQAVVSGEPGAIINAYSERLDLLSAKGDLRGLDRVARDLYEWSIPRAQTVFPCVMLAGVLLSLGELVDVEGIVRTGLAGTGHPAVEAEIRLHAGVLAVRRGATAAAREHRARAYEILTDLEEMPTVMAGAPLAEMLLAEGDAAGSFELVERVLPLNTIDPRVLDDLIVWGARAAAERVQRAADDRDEATVQACREALTRLVKMRATMPGAMFQASCADDTMQPARAALFAAESARAREPDDPVSPWREAVVACARAGLGWEEQLSSWRLASALIESGASRTEAADLLRGVHEYAVQQGATPLKTRVEELAASARISLTTPTVSSAAAVPTAFSGLTAREAEVLAHLVANRTNAEIAKTLFISEKTVSVHVSNLLRKTGTGSRREVAALARRVGWGTS